MQTSNTSQASKNRPPLTKEQVLAISAKYPFKEFDYKNTASVST